MITFSTDPFLNDYVAITTMSQNKCTESVIDKTDLSERDEQYMGTKQWLSIYGLGARRLELWDVLGSVAFKHRDGIVDLKVKPENGEQTEAVSYIEISDSLLFVVACFKL